MQGNLEDYGVEFEQRDCPVCPGLGVVLGFLGNRAWYRCRDCGMEFNIMVDKLGTVFTEASQLGLAAKLGSKEQTENKVRM